MGWTTPKTWTTEPLTSLDLNTHLRDNLNALKHPPTAHATPASTQSFSATSYQNISGTTLALTTTGGDVMVGFLGWIRASVGFNTQIAVRLGGVDYTVAQTDHDLFVPVGGVHLLPDVSAGTHSITLRARVNGGVGQVNIRQIWAREVT
ncbi:MAG: hypothetical protein EA396_10805 [Anaerolineaceae bacterium]|nr:MAG: hypothetical protein EA396_10805 [Anaerolineaceae bacterium]